jgi:predicted cupin superfamily sugar epimerase
MLVSAQTAPEIIDELGLQPYRDGVYRGADPSCIGLYLLVGDGFLGWHMRGQDISWNWHGGAACVVTLSPNGHDASATHLSAQSSDLFVTAETWMTLVSLGQWSLIEQTPISEDDGVIFADADWYPSPRPS